MLVNSVSLSLHITGDGTYAFSRAGLPAVQLVMDTYQNPIFTTNATTSGVTGTATIYSTRAFGMPAPSGSVDSSSSNPISVDFSSLRLAVNITSPFTQSFDAPVWPSTTPNSTSTYNAGTNAYTLTWSNNFSVTSSTGVPVSGTMNVTLGGTLTPVPVPASLWLFGSGLVGLAGIARRRKSAA